MNRNNFLPHVALALVIILIAAFAGQVRQWRKHRHGHGTVVFSRLESRAYPQRADTGGERQRPKKAEVFVHFKTGTSTETIQSLITRFQDRIEDRVECENGLELIEDEQGESVAGVIADYKDLPQVEYVEEVYQIQADGLNPVLPNDPRFEDQWALANTGQNGGTEGADISAKLAWASTKGSDKVVVAVLDSGVDYNHFDLANNMWTRPDNIAAYYDNELGDIDDEHGFNAIVKDGDPMDDNGHGTHCAGIIGAEGGNERGITGVNWSVQIMPLKFMDASGSGTTRDAIEAINYVINRKKAGVNVRVISASWGSTQKSRALEDVIRKAGEADILFVAASGNSSVDTDRQPHYPSSYKLDNVISVAALDRNDQLASFSNYGLKSVHIAAPGKEILSTWLDNDFREASGTSMATPMVAGVAALVLSKNSNMTVADLRKQLFKSVDTLPALKGKVVTGGRINAAKAVGAE